MNNAYLYYSYRNRAYKTIDVLIEIYIIWLPLVILELVSTLYTHSLEVSTAKSSAANDHNQIYPGASKEGRG